VIVAVPSGRKKKSSSDTVGTNSITLVYPNPSVDSSMTRSAVSRTGTVQSTPNPKTKELSSRKDRENDHHPSYATKNRSEEYANRKD
jgi:hypothetical protein